MSEKVRKEILVKNMKIRGVDDGVVNIDQLIVSNMSSIIGIFLTDIELLEKL